MIFGTLIYNFILFTLKTDLSFGLHHLETESSDVNDLYYGPSYLLEG